MSKCRCSNAGLANARLRVLDRQVQTPTVLIFGCLEFITQAMSKKRIRNFGGALIKALNHDFCPSANTYVYWLKQPIGWVVAGIFASLLVGLFIGPQGYVLTGAFLTLLLLGVSWPWLCMKGLSCELKFDEARSVEGESTIVSLDIVNRLPIPAFGVMIQGQFLQDLNHEDDVIAVSLKRVAALSVSNFQWPLTPMRRGKLPSQSPLLVTGFPFGLYQISKPISVVGNTIVWPKCDDVENSFETVGSQFAIEATSSRQAGNDGETIGVRNYRFGDSVRNIHWSHTARHNRLIIRERQSSTQTPIRVVLDLRRGQHSGSDSRSTYEAAIRMAASLCKDLHRHQCQIELVCQGLRAPIPSRSNNHRGEKPLIDFLALLPQLEDESAFDSAPIRLPLITEGVFTFLIHTARFIPETNSASLRYLCVNSSSEEACDALQQGLPSKSEIPQDGLPIDMSLPIHGLEANHVTG